MTVSTYFALLAEFNAAQIPLDLVAPKYFGMTPEVAKREAARGKLPVKAFRLAGQKSPWLVAAEDLAKLIDAKKAA